MVVRTHTIFLTSSTVEQIYHNRDHGFSIITTYDGESHHLILPRRFITMMVNGYDFVCVDVTHLEDQSGLILPFHVYRKRIPHIALAKTA